MPPVYLLSPDRMPVAYHLDRGYRDARPGGLSHLPNHCRRLVTITVDGDQRQRHETSLTGDC